MSALVKNQPSFEMRLVCVTQQSGEFEARWQCLMADGTWYTRYRLHNASGRPSAADMDLLASFMADDVTELLVGRYGVQGVLPGTG